MLEIGRKELENILVQIDLAINTHDHWYRQLVRTLICKLDPDQHDISEDSHKLCSFGHWYYQYATPSLRSNPIFSSIEFEHIQLHHQAARLLNMSMGRMRIDSISYDQFANALERMRLQLLSLKHEIEHEIYNHDPLTGAYTRYGMLTALREQQEMISRGAGNCSIAMLDIDNFKMVNDQYGHKVGDRILANIASIIIKDLRPYDKLYRYGGEEFIILFPNTTLESALMISERLRELIENSAIEFENIYIRSTASFGVTLIKPDTSVENSLEEANMAMNAAKRNGRNQIKLWEPALTKKAVSMQ